MACEISLFDYINAGFWFDENEMKKIIYQLLKIKVLFSNKIVHGDASPGNILITTSGDIKLCDFKDSYYYKRTLKDDDYPFNSPQKMVTSKFLSLEVYFWTWHPYTLGDSFRYDPFKACILFANRVSINELSVYQAPSELTVIYLQNKRSELPKAALVQFFKQEKKFQKKIDDAIETLRDKNLIYS